MSDRTDIIAENNRDALRRLMRIVTRSQGFSLSIALCNYRVLQERVLHDLRSHLAEHDLPETAIAILELEPDAKTLLAPIQKLMAEVHKLPSEQKPKVLMVLGLDAVIEIEAVLKSANRVREEFANCLEFPMVLWLSDRTQDILTREASDLANWTTAGAIELQLEAVELKVLVQDSLNAIFNRYLQPQGLGDWDASLQQMELMTAIAELEGQQIEIDPELRAGLDFAFGSMAMTEGEIEKAKDLLQRSLGFWRQSGAQPQQAICLLQLGMCDQNKAFRDRYHKQPFYKSAQAYLAECIAILRNLQRWELVALYINFLTAIMEELLALTPSPSPNGRGEQSLTPSPSPIGRGEQEITLVPHLLWERGLGSEGLESLAQEALALHQTYPNQLREAHDRGILASVKLWQKDYSAAKELAESSLALYHEGEALQLSNFVPSQRYAYCKLELWLARALEGLGDLQSAIRQLEAVRDRWNHQYDAQIYVLVLEELRSLYTAAGLYLEAFKTKQHQRSVEQQYGLRAFIGAGTLNPKREANNPELYVNDVTSQSDEIAQEIEASGRMPDVEKLVDRIGQARFPLTIVHGDSGAGKSSILSGGVIPALRLRESFDGRKVLVLAVKTYKDWSAEIQQQLQNYFGDRRPLLDPIHHFKLNIEANYLTVLIFDQFEDFFFKKEDFRDRLPFYRFLKASLYIDFVQVVLSMREDYLHYLLEFDRSVKVKELPKDFEGDILGKQVRYYLGDFTQEQARQVIEALTRRSQLRLEPELIERLVTDLSNEQHRILPIELQVVGAQLESENPPVSTLQQYLALTGNTAENRGRKPSEVLVERWLENVVRDCGVANQDLAERVLYALTGNEEKRPQKTQAELASELLAEENLSLVLAVLVGSGLAFRVSSSPDDRFQLIHDYLVSFIRKKYVFGMAEELRMTKEQLRSALVEKEKELQRAEIAEIEALSISCESYWLAHHQLEAMIAGVKAGQRILSPSTGKIIPEYLAKKSFGQLWKFTHNIYEYNCLEGHSNWVRSVAFSHDGKIIISSSGDKTIKLWNLQGKELRTLKGHTSDVLSVAFSPNDKVIASGSFDNTLKLWNLEGKELYTLKGHSKEVRSVAFSPDGKLIASGSADKTIKVWNLEGKELSICEGHHAGVRSLSFSPDGKMIASGSLDRTIKLWDLEGKELLTFKSHMGAVLSVAFAPNGKYIISASDDHTIRLLDLEGQELRIFKGHYAGVRSVSFSPDGKIILSSSDDKTIKLWNLEGEEILTLEGHSNKIWSVAFSPNGKTIASGSNDKTVKLWNLKDREQCTIFKGHNEKIWSVVFSPDSKTIASCSFDKTVKLWDLEGKELITFKGHTEVVRSVIFSPDGQTIVSGSSDKTIKLWNLKGKELLTINGHSGGILSLAFSPDSKKIVSSSFDQTLKLWNLDGKELLTLNGHNKEIRSVVFSPNGKMIASGSNDNTIKLWDLESKKVLTIDGHSSGVLSVAFSPDGKMIASGSNDNTIKLWDLQGKEVLTIDGHSSGVVSVAFSPDGKTIISGSFNNTIKLWYLDGKELLTIEDIDYKSFRSVVFSPSGKMIASASNKHKYHTIKLWDIDYDRAISQACDWLRPYLTNNPNVSESDRQLLTSKK